jgi:hypothetical protein
MTYTDLILAVVGLIGGFVFAVFALHRCRNHWQLVLIAVWKIGLSLFNGLAGVTVAIRVAG